MEKEIKKMVELKELLSVMQDYNITIRYDKVLGSMVLSSTNNEELILNSEDITCLILDDIVYETQVKLHSKLKPRILKILINDFEVIGMNYIWDVKSNFNIHYMYENIFYTIVLKPDNTYEHWRGIESKQFKFNEGKSIDLLDQIEHYK